MRRLSCLVVVTAFVLLACGSEDPVTSVTHVHSGITGQVFRSPINPVSSPGVTNEEPFAATFHLFKDNVKILEFQTGQDGRFRLSVAPGDYTIIADANAPILFPSTQVKAVTVSEGPIESVRLDFDTGIR